MQPKPLERKLTAILYTDVVGYSRLTGEDEEGTHRALSSHLDAITASIEKHNGKALHFAGDAVLAEFATVSDALICAAAVQQDLKERNKDLPDDRKVQFRIGVNLGEVIVDRNEIYGDGVNLAARLESLAEPAGICISESVHTAVGNKLPLEYEFIGEQDVKNITKPVRAYSAKLRPGAVLPAPSVRPKAQRPMHHVMAAAAAATVLIIGAGVIAWWQPWQMREEPASLERMAFPLPDKPSIAILPFDNLSGDQEQEYFSDGMTDDLITDLSKISGLFVISRNSTFTYKGKAVKIRQVAEELGVRYVLEGSVRKVHDQVRINAQLIDASTGAHLWAERYDGELSDILGLQDQVTSKIVAALAVNLTTEEAVGRSQLETDNPASYDAFLQGWARYQKNTPADYAKAIALFEEAIKHDPSFSRAYAALAFSYWRIVDHDWADQAGLEWQDAVDNAKAYLARAREKPTSLSHSLASRMLLWRRQYEQAISEAERAIQLDPNDPAGYLALSRALIRAGRPQEGADAIKKAMRLDPHYSPRYLVGLGIAQFGMEQYAEAAASFERAVKRSPDFEFTYRWLAAVYGQLGRERDAKTALDKYNTLTVKRGGEAYTLARVGVWGGYQHREDEDRLREGLRKAGVAPGADPSTDYRKLITESLDGYEVKGAKKIDVTTAKVLFDRGVTFVDVRGDTSDGVIPGARLIELNNELSQERLAEVARRDDEVVFYCSGTSCYKSAHACAKALTWGFRNVYYFAKGMPGWVDAGYPVEMPSG